MNEKHKLTEEEAEDLALSIREDEIREMAAECCDARFDVFVDSNEQDLIGEYIEENKEDFEQFCKAKYEEYED